jgi:phosphatidylinositol-4,5-bisphosphate 3-kinase catalytic subunit alpha/beta/delta
MSCYGCIATGDGVGMIEVVLNAETTAHIHIQAGGASAALFKSDPLANWIRSHNPKGNLLFYLFGLLFFTRGGL